MILFRHSSASILMSDSGSSQSKRSRFIERLRTCEKCGAVLTPGRHMLSAIAEQQTIFSAFLNKNKKIVSNNIQLIPIVFPFFFFYIIFFFFNTQFLTNYRNLPRRVIQHVVGGLLLKISQRIDGLHSTVQCLRHYCRIHQRLASAVNNCHDGAPDYINLFIIFCFRLFPPLNAPRELR